MIALVLGGASSGKSETAERLVGTLPPPVTYLATWTPQGPDPEMQARVQHHRSRRPAHWVTVEAGPDLPGVVGRIGGTILVDALGTWVAGAPGFVVDHQGLCAALQGRTGDAVIVSDEVGMGVHPASEAGRRFRDALGPVNVAVAAIADPVWLVVAGRVLPLGRAPGGIGV